MPRYRSIQNSMIAGEVSPRLFGRTDLSQYRHAMAEIRNAIPMQQGGSMRRAGTELISLAGMSGVIADGAAPGNTRFNNTGGGSSSRSVLIPFVDSIEGSLFIELHLTADPGAISMNIFRSKEDIDANIVTVSTQNSDGGWTRDELQEIQWVQYGNAIFFVHGNHQPHFIGRVAGVFQLRKLLENGDALQSVAPIFPHPEGLTSTVSILSREHERYSYKPVGPMAAGNAMNIFDTGAGITADVAAELRTTGAFFVSTHIGKVFGLYANNQWAFARVTSIVSTTRAAVVTLSNFNATHATGTVIIKESYWGGHSGGGTTTSINAGSDGYPRTVAVYKGRLVFGGSEGFPDHIWTSWAGNVITFSEFGTTNRNDINAFTGAANEPFADYLDANVVSDIRWMLSSKSLAVGTRGTEYLVQSAAPNLAFGSTSRQATAETQHGARIGQAIMVGDSPVFIDRSGKKIRELSFNFQQDSFVGQDLSVAAEHMPKRSEELEPFSPSEIIRIAYQDSPNQAIWAIDSNGKLFSCTRNKAQNIIAWAHHELGGHLDKTVTISSIDTTDNLLASNNHNLRENEEVTISSTLQFPVPLLADTKYYVRLFGPDKFGLAAEINGDPIDITTAGTGTITVKAERPPKVRSITTVPSEDYTNDDLYLIVERTINDNTDFCIERMNNIFELPELFNRSASVNEKPIFFDMAKVYQSFGSGTTSWTINAPYAGEKVSVLADGIYIGEYEVAVSTTNFEPDLGVGIPGVAKGELEIDEAAEEIIVGYSYRSKLLTLKLDAGSASESAQAAIQRIDEATVRMTKTLGAKIGASEDSLEDIIFREPSDLAGRPPRLFTGDKTVKFSQSPRRDAQVCVIQDLPYPMYVNSFIFRGVTND